MSKVGEPIQEPKYVQIEAKKYDQMVKDIDFLECLRAAGVDNWQGYDDVVTMWREGN